MEKVHNLLFLVLIDKVKADIQPWTLWKKSVVHVCGTVEAQGGACRSLRKECEAARQRLDAIRL